MTLDLRLRYFSCGVVMASQQGRQLAGGGLPDPGPLPLSSPSYFPPNVSSPSEQVQ